MVRLGSSVQVRSEAFPSPAAFSSKWDLVVRELRIWQSQKKVQLRKLPFNAVNVTGRITLQPKIGVTSRERWSSINTANGTGK